MTVNSDFEDELLGLPNAPQKAEVISSKVGAKKRVWEGKVLTKENTPSSVGNLKTEKNPKGAGRPRKVVKTTTKAVATKVDILPAEPKMTRADVATIIREHKLVKDVFADTFADLQHLDPFSLKTWAMANQTEFYKLAAKLIPVQLTGEGGGPLTLKAVTFE